MLLQVMEARQRSPSGEWRSGRLSSMGHSCDAPAALPAGRSTSNGRPVVQVVRYGYGVRVVRVLVRRSAFHDASRDGTAQHRYREDGAVDHRDKFALPRPRHSPVSAAGAYHRGAGGRTRARGQPLP